MKKNFEATLEFIMKEEGGYTVDHAGATNMGLTVGLMKALNLDLNHDGVVNGKDVVLVDRGVVAEVFRTRFWDPMNGDGLPSGLDLTATDFSYNAGPKAAKALLGTNGTDIALYTLGRQLYYWQLRTKNPGKYGIYFDGWIGRSLRAWQKAVDLAGGV